MQRSPRTFTMLIALAVASTLFPTSSPATAQGTSGSLPPPIGGRELTAYARMLDLTEEQRWALDTARADYQQQFRRLRDGEIAAFLRNQGSMQGGIPQRKAVEDLLEELKRIQTKIEVLDNSLFDQLAPLLSDEQKRMVPRVRLARERARYLPLHTAASFGRRAADLSVPFRDLELTTEQFTVGDAIITGYERRLTTILREQNQAVTHMTLDMMDLLAERGYVDITQEELLQDPALVQEVVNQVREAYAGLRAGVSELTRDLRELNNRTYQQLSSVIPPAEARTLRNAFCRESYPELSAIATKSETDWITRALQLSDLGVEQRAALEASSARLQQQLTGLLEDGIATMDDFWDTFSPYELNQEKAQALRASLDDLKAQADAAQAQAETALTQSLGEEAVEELRRAVARLDLDLVKPSVAGAGSDEESAEAEEEPARRFAIHNDRFLPDPISRRDIRRYTKQLRLHEDMSEVTDMLHADYMQQLRDLEVLEQLHNARTAASAGADSERPLEDRIQDVYDLRRRAVEAMAAIDDAFFEDLRTVVGADNGPLLERVRRSRLRRTYGGSASERFALGRDHSREGGVDLVSLLLEQQPSDADLKRVDEVLTGYEDAALTGFRARLEAQLDLQQLSDQWAIEIERAAREDIATVLETQNRYRADMQAPTRRAEQADTAIVTLNRSTLEQLRERLSSNLAATLRREYDLAAFPSVYNDPASVDRQLTAALNLQDLTTSRREELKMLGTSYREEYARLSRQMIEQLPTTSVNVVGLDPAAFREWQARQQQLAKIRFDRNELNARAISRLRAILTEDQIHRIGGLPEPPGEDEFFFYR